MNTRTQTEFAPVVRDLHRSEGERFIEFSVENAGQMDRAVGLLDRSEREIQTTFRPGVWFLLRLLRAVGRAPVRFLVSVEADVLIGSTIVAFPRPWAYVAGVATSPQYRRRGVARALMARAEQLAQSARAEWVVLDVDQDNDPARHLYEQLGYATVSKNNWWKLPSETATLSPTGASEGRVPSEAEVEQIRNRVQANIGIPLLRGTILPVEFVLQVTRGTRSDWARGPPGSATYLARSLSSTPEEAAYLVGVPEPDCSLADATATLGEAWTELQNRGCRRVFSPAPASDSTSSQALERLGATVVASSVTMGKRLR